ncbi:phage head closure protein [uncultured Cohaesibacter sp.]|uniref:phage head closure protein n=1 Tax=uncultured Cohaesibacter sp. TaxID=1002546 RepID=UPI0029C75A18|nr:phage head closure protein [uncultured Cohaesibacter sp.]
MRAGTLNKRVTFNEPLHSIDASGGLVEAWGDDLTVWGGFRPERGREQQENGRLQASVSGILRVRSSSETRAIGEHWRVLIDGEDYSIQSITNPDQRNRELEIIVTRGGLD